VFRGRRANTEAAARRDSPAAGRGRPPGPAADNLPGVLCPFYVLDVSPSDTHNQIHKALEWIKISIFGLRPSISFCWVEFMWSTLKHASHGVFDFACMHSIYLIAIGRGIVPSLIQVRHKPELGHHVANNAVCTIPERSRRCHRSFMGSF
jgi:hypothetical protein